MNFRPSPLLGTSDDIERTLRLAEGEWPELLTVEAEIDTWDLGEQISYIEELCLKEMRFTELSEHANAGRMAATQRVRFDALSVLVAKGRPIIERLRKS